MKTSELIEGLTILQKYRDSDGYDMGAEHDIFYAYRTDKPLSPEDAALMVTLGWFQHDVQPKGDEFTADDYDPEEGWAAFT